MGVLDKIIQQSAIKAPTDLALSNEARTDKKPQNNAFPHDVFPQKIQSAISATNATLNYPTDFTSASILLAASGAIGTTLKAKVKRGYTLHPQIYIILVGKPGTVKSHPVTYSLNPIFNRDKAYYKSYLNDVKLNDDLNKLPIKEQKASGIEIIPPVLKKHIISDATIEAVNFVLSNNPRGLICYNDEGIAWIKNLNRYRSGSDQEYWLSNWSGKPIISDRKSSTPIYIQNPFISFIGTIQPSVLNELSKDGRDSNGFIDRILFVYPDNLTVSPWSEGELSDEVTKDYELIIQNLLDISPAIDQAGDLIPKEISFSDDAFKILKAWQIQNSTLSNDCEDPELSGVYSKLEIYCIRFALILQALYWASCEDDLSVINARATEGAIKVTEYFRVTANKIFELVHNTDPVSQLPENHQRFFNALPSSFKTSEGEEIALRNEIAERTYQRLLKNKNLFRRVRHGEYEKNNDGALPERTTKFSM